MKNRKVLVCCIYLVGWLVKSLHFINFLSYTQLSLRAFSHIASSHVTSPPMGLSNFHPAGKIPEQCERQPASRPTDLGDPRGTPPCLHPFLDEIISNEPRTPCDDKESSRLSQGKVVCLCSGPGAVFGVMGVHSSPQWSWGQAVWDTCVHHDTMPIPLAQQTPGSVHTTLWQRGRLCTCCLI